MSAPNFYSWLQSRRYGAAAMDASPDWDESKIKRTAKGGKGGGQFAKKPETLAKEDGRDVLNPSDGGGSRNAYSLTSPATPQKASPQSGSIGGGVQPSKTKFRDASPEEFAAAIAAAKADCSSENAWRVSDYPASHYKDSKARIVTDAGSCIAVQENGDIVSLCRAKGERPDIRGHHLMEEAIRRKGDRCDSYDGNWTRYIRAGLTPVSWTPWNPEYAPDGWDGRVNAPEDVIFFMYTGDTTPIDMAEWKRRVKPFTGDTGYNDAMAERDRIIEERKNRKSEN